MIIESCAFMKWMWIWIALGQLPLTVSAEAPNHAIDSTFIQDHKVIDVSVVYRFDENGVAAKVAEPMTDQGCAALAMARGDLEEKSYVFVFIEKISDSKKAHLQATTGREFHTRLVHLCVVRPES